MRISVYLNLSVLFGQSFSSQLDSVFASFDGNGPGFAIILVDDKEVVYQKEIGQASMKYAIPISSKTIFPLASVSKHFTAYIISHLISVGKINLEDDIRLYLPRFKNIKDKITIANLLFHTSGLKDDAELFLLSGFTDYDFNSHERALDIIYNQHTLAFSPGSRQQYSNSGYTLLSEIIQNILEKSFSKISNELIFKPIGMERTQVKADVRQIIKNEAEGYEKGPDNNYYYSPFTQNIMGSSGIHSTIEDIGKWLIHLIGGLDNNVVQRMKSKGHLSNGEEIDYGFGLVNGSFHGKQTLSHSGRNNSFLSYLSWLPNEKIGVTVLSNNMPEANPVEIAQTALNHYLESNPGNAKSEFNIFDKKMIAQEKTTYVFPVELNQYVNTYWQADGNYLRSIENKGDSLVYVRSAYSKSVLEPQGNRKFLMKGTNNLLIVEFEKRKDGYFQMWVKLNDEVPTLYQPSDLYGKINPDEFNEYEGLYISKELMKIYEIYIEDGKVKVFNPGQPRKTLNSTIKDHFNGGPPWWLGYDLHFERGDHGHVLGFWVQQFHAKNIWFEKLK